jgi:hypothetical protein
MSVKLGISDKSDEIMHILTPLYKALKQMVYVAFSEAKAGSDVLPFSSIRLLLFLKVEQNSLCIFFSLYNNMIDSTACKR